MNPIEKYFSEERVACWIGVGIGVAAILAAVWFLWQVKKPFYAGMAYPLMVLGLFFLVICLGVALRSQRDIDRINTMLKTDKTQIHAVEVPRMATVMRNFKYIIAAEIVLMVLSAAGLFFFQSATWRGVCASVLLMASLLLVFDLLADRRGRIYFQYLEGLERIS